MYAGKAKAPVYTARQVIWVSKWALEQEHACSECDRTHSQQPHSHFRAKGAALFLYCSISQAGNLPVWEVLTAWHGLFRRRSHPCIGDSIRSRSLTYTHLLQCEKTSS